MHSFDIVSKINMQELTNAVNQAVKEIQTRYDFKDSKSTIELGKDEIVIHSDDDFKLKAVIDILQNKMIKRAVPIKALKYGKVEEASGSTVRQHIKLQNGIEQDQAKKIVAMIKDLKMKVQASIQGDQVRVQAKDIDDLQAIIKTLKEKNFDFAMQFENYR
ncbi:YajQ family cyclic di-GMP-binding protein [bacterium]|nr:YajQ family cyclic di-GMP-binding protein [bacterium]NUN46527.1 YajQ family cyclic di-GMP-binding protein [bacterium]HMV26114.1 YajQ family cyclic di-GMP-binding protein [bacterium]HMW33080.1 YajQ family cyclic di-GMP-binding protein [bacterium]HMW36510.1 YajQ family cyclic di-GMP-binding protein [bacterium]